MQWLMGILSGKDAKFLSLVPTVSGSHQVAYSEANNMIYTFDYLALIGQPPVPNDKGAYLLGFPIPQQARSQPAPTSFTSTFGLNSGNSTFTITGNSLNVMRFQNTVGTGTLNKLEILFRTSNPSGNVRLGVYADNNGSPGNLLLDAGPVPVANGWVGIGGLNLPVTLNGYYWLAFDEQSANGVTFLSNAANTARIPHDWHDGVAYGPLPSAFGTATGSNTSPYVMRATVNSP